MRKRQDKLKQPQSIKDKQLSLDQNNSGSYIFGSYAASKTLQPTDSSKSQHEISPIADDMDEAQNGDFQILSVEQMHEEDAEGWFNLEHTRSQTITVPPSS